jgi:hypothetical protein
MKVCLMTVWKLPATMVLLLLSTQAVNADVLNVTPQGASVQQALDRAHPGDTVHLKPGVYRERVVFKQSGAWGKPITLEGEPGAILDGSDDVLLDWQAAPDVAPGAYRAKVGVPVFTVVANGKILTMLREDRVRPGQEAKRAAWDWTKLFKSGVGPSGWEGVKALALYFEKNQELLVRFQGDLDPSTLPITVSAREPVIKISGANRCVVRGLTLRNAAYGVWIENSLGSVVENCTIGPVDYGVWLSSGSARCTVRLNEIFMNPYAGADPRGLGAWDNWQAHKSGGHYDRMGIEIHKTRGGHEIHDNFIHDQWDGIEDRGAPDENVGLRIHHNRIFNVSDDGLEPNGGEEDCRWNDNIVERSICGFRIKAPTIGPLYAYRNIFFDNKEDFRNYGEVELKPARVYIYHNTSTAPAAIVSNKVFGIGTPNYHYYNNLFWTDVWWRNSSNTSLPPNWKGDYNVYVRRGQNARWDEMRKLAGELKLEAHSIWTTGDPGFNDFVGRDVTLKPGSPARGHGADLSNLLGVPLPGLDAGDKPDVGAIPFGRPMPKLPRKVGELEVVPAGSWPGPEAETQAAAINAQTATAESGDGD